MSANHASPKYKIIIDDLLERIKKNDYSYDNPLCTEKQLSLDYDVSRITAKRAITELEQQGILYRKRGVGSFVSKDSVAKSFVNTNISIDNSNTFVLLTPFDISKGDMLRTVDVVNTVLSKKGFFMGVYITNDINEERSLKQLIEKKYAGLVYYPLKNNIHLNLLKNFVLEGKPVIIVDKPIECSYLHNVTSDNLEGGRQLTEHLIELGHRNIAFMCDSCIDEVSSVGDRFGGYLNQLKSAGITPNSEFIVESLNVLEGLPYPQNDVSIRLLNAVKQLYSKKITAIITENDELAYYVLLACEKLNISVPSELSICGFDNSMWSKKENISITTINQDFIEMGEQISHILLQSSCAADLVPAKHIIPVKLIVGDTTDKPRFDL
ncbi:GntR family transcriptional regulator [Lachnoclostridium sp.]|nr:GntR family transcriptional regulator [Lachnoclostridium sp.]